MSDPAKFVCGECGGTFDKGWSDEDAQAEMLANFGELPDDDRVTVCDDCFQAMERNMRAAGLDFGDVDSHISAMDEIQAWLADAKERERARVLAEHGEVGLYIHDQIEAELQRASLELLMYGSYTRPANLREH